MHIRQLFVAGIILFGTAQMEAGKNGNQKTWRDGKKSKWAAWKRYKELNKAETKRDLNSTETKEFSFLRSSFEEKANAQKTLEQPNRYEDTELFDINNYGLDG